MAREHAVSFEGTQPTQAGPESPRAKFTGLRPIPQLSLPSTWGILGTDKLACTPNRKETCGVTLISKEGPWRKRSFVCYAFTCAHRVQRATPAPKAESDDLGEALPWVCTAAQTGTHTINRSVASDSAPRHTHGTGEQTGRCPRPPRGI